MAFMVEVYFGTLLRNQGDALKRCNSYAEEAGRVAENGLSAIYFLPFFGRGGGGKGKEAGC